MVTTEYKTRIRRQLKQLYMISSAFFFAAAKIVFFFKVLAPLLQPSDRREQKLKLISVLSSLKQMKLEEIAVTAIHLANRGFNKAVGTQILSTAYLIKCVMFGLGLGLFISSLALMLVTSDVAQAMRVVSSRHWWQFIILPSIVVAGVLMPVDVACAHLLIRWSRQGGVFRAFAALVIAIPLSYFLWAVGTSVGAVLGLFVATNYLSPSFVLNRFVMALLNPVQSAASIQLGVAWFSYGLLAASSALSSLLISIVFLIAALVRAFPTFLQQIMAAPVFWMLDLLNILDRKKASIPIRIVSWSAMVLLFAIAVVLRSIGF